MIKGNKRKQKLLIGILLCLIGLAVCMTVDSATETITSMDNRPITATENVTILNGTSYIVMDKGAGIAVSDGKIYTEKPKKPKAKTITMTGRPSCTSCARNHRAYKWSTHTYINYCPNCHRHGTLFNKHKWQSRHEQEITCRHCDSDFCIRCGKEKYSWSHVHLKKP